MAGLGDRDARAIRSFDAELGDFSGGADFLAALAVRLERLVPSAAAVVYDLTEDGQRRHCGHTLSTRTTAWSDIPGHERVPGLARYQYRGAAPPDRWANTAVLERDLYFGDPVGLEELRELILEPCGVRHQLRVALYDGSRFLGLAVLVRTKRQKDFGERERRLLQAVTPALADVLGARRFVSDVPAPRVVLAPLLDALERPAYLVSERGHVVHCNALARLGSIPSWLKSVIDAEQESRRHERGHAHGLDIDGKRLWLVLARELPPSFELPPSLEGVAECIMEGLSDKEIAERTRKPLRTVRTYVQRIYRKVGVRSRVELLRRARERR